MNARDVVSVFGGLAMLGLLIGYVSVLKQNRAVPEPKPEPQYVDIRECPMILGEREPGRCRYRPDGTIEAYELQAGGWVSVE